MTHVLSQPLENGVENASLAPQVLDVFAQFSVVCSESVEFPGRLVQSILQHFDRVLRREVAQMRIVNATHSLNYMLKYSAMPLKLPTP